VVSFSAELKHDHEEDFARAMEYVLLTVPSARGAAWDEGPLFCPLTGDLQLGVVIHIPFSLSPEIKSQ